MRLALVLAIALGSTSLASAGNWDSFIEKKGDKLPASKSPTVKSQKSAAHAKPAPKKKAKQARGKKH